MVLSRDLRFRLMTYNIGGGRKSYINEREDFDLNFAAILEVIRDISPDVLVIQEATDYQDADKNWFSASDQIAQVGGFGGGYYFGPTLTMQEHMHVGKAVMVYGLFKDWLDWRQGNAVFSRWGFTRLSDTSKAGYPRNVPLYRPPLYEGNRDTDPRYALLARVNRAPLFPFVVGVHLTTLVGERGSKELPGKAEQAQALRVEQARRLLNLMRQRLLECEELVFLLGDLNAEVSEPSISSVLESEAGFVRLIPTNPIATHPIATHPKVADAVDHIFIYPSHRLVKYQCWIVDTETARRASDHLPVVADVTVK